ncbi:MAG: hypothetical protein ACYCSN_19870 [Acidobacteriaceae bacterium]
MSTKPSDQLNNVLRATLAQVEQESGVSPDDPALVALKRIVLQRIADLELAQAVDPHQSLEAIDSGVIQSASESQNLRVQAVTEGPQSKGDKLA